MSEPSTSDREIQLERKFTEVKDFGRFKIEEKTFRSQYCNIYTARLTSLRGPLSERVKQKWGIYRINH